MIPLIATDPRGWKAVSHQLEEDKGEDAGEEAHDRHPHDHLEDVVLVVGLVLRDLNLLIQEERPTERVDHYDCLHRDDDKRAQGKNI